MTFCLWSEMVDLYRSEWLTSIGISGEDLFRLILRHCTGSRILALSHVVDMAAQAMSIDEIEGTTICFHPGAQLQHQPRTITLNQHRMPNQLNDAEWRAAVHVARRGIVTTVRNVHEDAADL